jgi:SAM-dependent methyltransferase
VGLIKAIDEFIHKQREKRAFARMSMEEIFTRIYHTNKWGESESVSGKGSSLKQTRKIREAIPELLGEFQIRSMLDLPCGDFHWMKEVDLSGIDYTGADIVSEMIDQNNALYGNGQRQFVVLDLTRDELPKVDLLLCRDCWVHLNYRDLAKANANIRRSGIPYLLTTTFTKHAANRDKLRGKFRMLNLQLAPFNFPEPLLLIKEDNLDSRHSDFGKNLALWRVEDMPALVLY